MYPPPKWAQANTLNKPMVRMRVMTSPQPAHRLTGARGNPRALADSVIGSYPSSGSSPGGAGKPAAKLEVPPIKQATGEELPRSASSLKTPRHYQIDHFLGGSPLVDWYAGVKVGKLAAKARLTPFRHRVVRPRSVGCRATSSTPAGPPDACAAQHHARVPRLETQSDHCRGGGVEDANGVAHAPAGPVLPPAATLLDTSALTIALGTTVRIQIGPSLAALPRQTSQARAHGRCNEQGVAVSPITWRCQGGCACSSGTCRR